MGLPLLRKGLDLLRELWARDVVGFPLSLPGVRRAKRADLDVLSDSEAHASGQFAKLRTLPIWIALAVFGAVMDGVQNLTRIAQIAFVLRRSAFIRAVQAIRRLFA